MALKFDVHGFWLIGAVLMFSGSMIAGNIRWIQGATPSSMAVSMIIALVMIVVAGVLWISSAVNAGNDYLR